MSNFTEISSSGSSADACGQTDGPITNLVVIFRDNANARHCVRVPSALIIDTAVLTVECGLWFVVCGDMYSRHLNSVLHHPLP